MPSCFTCGEWNCGRHGSDYDPPELVPCKHCDRLVYLRGSAWIHITGAKVCHPWLNGDVAEPSEERKAG
jgi:hypothetical protein